MTFWIMVLLGLVIFNVLAVNFVFPEKFVDFSRTLLLIVSLILLYKSYKNIKSRFG